MEKLTEQGWSSCHVELVQKGSDEVRSHLSTLVGKGSLTGHTETASREESLLPNTLRGPRQG